MCVGTRLDPANTTGLWSRARIAIARATAIPDQHPPRSLRSPRYQSHALRFEVKRPFESVDEFRKRINPLAEGEQRAERTSDDGWFTAGARYALLVSIETPGVDTDIWTPVANQIGVPVEVVV